MIIPTFLTCPICSEKLEKTENSLKCPKNHSYDFAKSGYINLLNPGKKNNAKTGESKEMIKARTSFFETEAYAKIRDFLCDIISPMKKDVIIDAGCGEGYYDEGMASRYTDSIVIGFDMSKHGTEHGARSSKAKGIANTFFSVSNIFNMPIESECADIVVNMFAPVSYDEFARVLKSGGYLIIGASGKNHLYEMKESIYDTVHLNEFNNHENSLFEKIEVKNLKYVAEIHGSESIMNLFTMTPYYHHTSSADKEKIMALNTLKTTIEVDFTILRKI